MLKIKVNPRDRVSVVAAFVMISALMNELNKGEQQPVQKADAPTPPPPPAKEETPARRKAKTPASTETTAPADNTPFAEEGITLTKLREVLAEKVDDNRDAILEKLQSFGAGNLTSLDPVHHPAMYNFLKSL